MKTGRSFSCWTTSNGPIGRPPPRSSSGVQHDIPAPAHGRHLSQIGALESPPLDSALAEYGARSGVSRIELSGLDDTGVLAFMEAAAGHDLDQTESDWLSPVSRTDGNPFSSVRCASPIGDRRHLPRRRGAVDRCRRPRSDVHARQRATCHRGPGRAAGRDRQPGPSARRGDRTEFDIDFWRASPVVPRTSYSMCSMPPQQRHSCARSPTGPAATASLTR